MILNLLEELTGKYLNGAIPEEFCSKMSKFHPGFGGKFMYFISIDMTLVFSF